jgi:hypothetical protein
MPQSATPHNERFRQQGDRLRAIALVDIDAV